MTWKQAQMGDLVRFRNGKSIKPGGQGRHPVYGSNGLIGQSDEFLYCDAIILGRVGAYCGSVAYCARPFWASDNTIVVEPDKERFDTRYAYYALTHANLSRWAGGAAQPLITQTVLKGVPIPIPPVVVQRRIAGILSAYDDLIEVNMRRIAVLEEMARRLFDEWYVKYRPSGAKPSGFVASVLGDIPRGWDVVPLHELYQTSSGGTPSRDNLSYFEGMIPWVKTKELLGGPIFKTEECISQSGLDNSSARIFPPRTVIVAMYGATIGEIGISMVPAATNQACCALLPVTCEYGWAYAYLTFKTYKQRLVDLRTGAAQQNVSQAVIKKFPIIKPPRDVAVEFNRLVEPALDMSFLLHRSNHYLRNARDLLLPKLISGEIDLEQAGRDADRTIRRVAAA